MLYSTHSMGQLAHKLGHTRHCAVASSQARDSNKPGRFTRYIHTHTSKLLVGASKRYLYTLGELCIVLGHPWSADLVRRILRNGQFLSHSNFLIPHPCSNFPHLATSSNLTGQSTSTSSASVTNLAPLFVWQAPIGNYYVSQC